MQLFLDWGKGGQLSGFSDFLFCSQGVIVGFLEMKVFFYKNYFPQLAVTNLSLSAGASGSWSPSVLDEPKASHLAGALWNGFDIFRCQTFNSNSLVTDKVPVASGNSLDALYHMLEKCRSSLHLQFAALALGSDKGKGRGKDKGEGEDEGRGGHGGSGGDTSNDSTGTGKGQPNRAGSGNMQIGGNTRQAMQPVPLSTLNILLHNLEQSGEDFLQYF